VRETITERMLRSLIKCGQRVRVLSLSARMSRSGQRDRAQQRRPVAFLRRNSRRGQDAGFVEFSEARAGRSTRRAVGEASGNCAADAGGGIPSGAVGLVALTSPPEAYEIRLLRRCRPAGRIGAIVTSYLVTLHGDKRSTRASPNDGFERCGRQARRWPGSFTPLTKGKCEFATAVDVQRHSVLHRLIYGSELSVASVPGHEMWSVSTLVGVLVE
jgi:hypothetical protein